MKVVVLFGGLKTQLKEETQIRPKPMVEIGGRPILWHIMNIYAAHGYKEFIIALGYKGKVSKNYFLNYYYLNNDRTIYMNSGGVQVSDGKKNDWTVRLINTGLSTNKGGRLKRLTPFLSDGTFMVTYSDGVSNVNITELLAFHKRYGKLATVTAVRRERPAGLWEEVATAVVSEATLVEQPRGKELEYRIITVNKTGDGEPSNTAMVVL